jgi:polyphenol oxidase
MVEADLIRSSLFRQHGLIACFTLRTGGVSSAPFNTLNFGEGLGDTSENTAANLESLLKLAGIPDAPHQARQIHGTNVLHCSGKGGMRDQEADSLISDQAGTTLAVRTADCLPVLLADPEAGIIAAVHAGWRGTAANIAGRTIAHMQKLGASSARMIASLGPCIGSCCFHIGEETAGALAASAPDADEFIDHQQGTADLSGINHLQLQQAGLRDSNIETMQACTSCNSEMYFSFRRDHGKTGRHLAVVARPANT